MADAATLTRRQRYEQSYAALLTERSAWHSDWQTLSGLFFPNRTRFQTTERNTGAKRAATTVIDSAPKFAARTLQSGMHAGLTSPARPWMRMTTPDPDLSEHKAVKEWLHVVTQRMLTLFLRSNLYQALPTLYGDMGVFATAAMGELDDETDVLRFYSYPLGSYVVAVDARGIPSTVIRESRLTVEQVVATYGTQPGTKDVDWSRFSTHVKDQYDRGNYFAPVDVCWHVAPNDARLSGGKGVYAADTMRFRSCHFEKGRTEADFTHSQGFLRESGFNQFPVFVPRWDAAAEDTYGSDSPGYTALGDVNQLQGEQLKKAKAIAKALDPPLKGPSSLQQSRVSLLSGDVTYMAEDTGKLAPIHEVPLQGIEVLLQDMAEVRDRIRRAFYEDLFLMLARSESRGQPVTAREIEERHEEKLLALGPVLERTNDELLDLLVDRTFAIMLAKGFIPEPPEELLQLELKVEYLSVMSQAQKLVGVGGQDRFLQSTMALVEAFPNVRHKVHVFHAIDRYQDMLGVDPSLVRTDAEAQALVDAEQQAIQAQQQAELAKTGAQAAQALGNTPVNQGNTALDALAGRGV